jgi:hypothetical protein
VPLASAARGGETRTTGAPAVFNVTTGVPRERRGNGTPSAEVLAKNPCNGCGQFGQSNVEESPLWTLEKATDCNPPTVIVPQ